MWYTPSRTTWNIVDTNNKGNEGPVRFRRVVVFCGDFYGDLSEGNALIALVYLHGPVLVLCETAIVLWQRRHGRRTRIPVCSGRCC